MIYMEITLYRFKKDKYCVDTVKVWHWNKKMKKYCVTNAKWFLKIKKKRIQQCLSCKA